MKFFELTINKRRYPFTEDEITITEDFLPSECDDILALEVGDSVVLNDDSRMTRLT